MDPELTQRWMNEGKLPNFSRLAAQGAFQILPSTNPPESPVAWSSFATGTDAGQHGVFDFLRRNLVTYAPEYAIARSAGPARNFDLFGMRIPVGGASVVNLRVGTPFWESAEAAGIRASVISVPVTYPPDDVTRMVSGMGVPDLLGTQATFTFFGTRERKSDDGRYVRIEPRDGRVETVLEGPDHPFIVEPTPLTVPLTLEDAGSGRVRIELDGTELTLSAGQWSDWVSLRYSIMAVFGVPGIVRLHLVKGFPEPELYVSPIQIDPRDPVTPISSPPGYAEELADRIGLYHTIGMPEETWSLNEGLISDEAYLEMVKAILAEREAMFFDALDSRDTPLNVAVFVQTDRVSHMFYRGLDPGHPLYSESSPTARGAIEWIYGEADRILGRTMESLSSADRLIVLSDHGFAPFRRAVHLNRWLVEKGFMTLKPGAAPSESLFTNVLWTRTRAYALGMNGIFLNRLDREALGIVRDEEVADLKRAIARELEEFEDPVTGSRVVLHAYDTNDIYRGDAIRDAPDLVVGYAGGYRASWQTTLGGVPGSQIEDNTRNWSGDHCIDPSVVPGVLFTSFVPDVAVESIQDIPLLVQRTFADLRGKTTKP
jgi:predicted AlkP superfamily phosphohydrolase/phosphomutase